MLSATLKRVAFGLFGIVLASPVIADAVREERALARAVLSAIQERSFRANREFCGWLARDKDGKLFHSKVYRGSAATCRSRARLPAGSKVVATFHTHGAYLERYDNEVPSYIDMVNEKERGTRGYISTPGGRFWLIDGPRGVARLLCGPGCLPSDPRHQAKARDRIRSRYNTRQIYERNGNRGPTSVELCNGQICVD